MPNTITSSEHAEENSKEKKHRRVQTNCAQNIEKPGHLRTSEPKTSIWRRDICPNSLHEYSLAFPRAKQREEAPAGGRRASSHRGALHCSFVVIFMMFFFSPARPDTIVSHAELRVYGSVTASISPDRSLFTCVDSDHADILLGKLLADLFWDAGDQAVTTKIPLGNKQVLVRSWPPYGAVIVARESNKVLVLGAGDASALSVKAAHEPFFLAANPVFTPVKPYPQTLDFYDLKAVKLYTEAMASPHGLGLDSHWPFVQKFGLGGLAFQNLSFIDSCMAPGVVSWGASDYEVKAAESAGGMVVPSFEAAGGVPFWMHNQFPGAIAQPDPNALMIAWGMPSLSNLYCENWGAPKDLQNKYFMGFLKQVMMRYGSSPAVGGWQVYAGEPGAELGFHDRTTENLDYSPLGRESFLNYLRLVKGYTLAEVGERWYSDNRHYKSWGEVEIPDLHCFFGDLNADCFRIDSHWFWLPQTGDAAAKPGDSSNWAPVELTPSQQQVTMAEVPAFYKVSFDPTGWKSAGSGRPVYLVCDVGDRSSAGVHVWLNGKDYGFVKTASGAGYGPIFLDVTDNLRQGSNDLILLALGQGKIMGPVFLTTTKPAYFPDLGPGLNAQYADTKEWQTYSLYALHDAVFRAARTADPDRAMGMGTDEFGEMGGQVADLAVRYGMSVQNTGREAWYFPWWPGLGYVDGFYATSEPSATPSEDDLTRMLSWILFDGDSSTILFLNIEDFQKMQEANGWFSRHRRALQLEGKALRVKPAIALFRSTTTSVLGDASPWGWDIGRGELQSAHLDNVYVTEREILNGKVSDYPVLMDCGSEFIDPDTLAAIDRYIRGGGTFIALQNTGLNTSMLPKSYPISQLSGFTVTSASESGPIQFAVGMPAFGSWAGKTFYGGSGGLSLEQSAPGAISLALWKDGSTAVGCRKIGKGQIILLGSDFWRNGQGISDIFNSLGVVRDASSSSGEIWTRKFVTKNGLQNWIVAYNNGAAPVTSTLSMTVSSQPDAVIDLEANQNVPFTYANDTITIPNITIEGRENKVFAVKRRNLGDGVSVWWDEKVKYWKKAADLTGPARSLASAGSLAPADPAGLNTVAFDHWRFKPVSSAAPVDDRWKLPGYDDSGWETILNGPWNLLKPSMRSYQGAAEYRRSFSVPSAWGGHRVLLCLHAIHIPVVYGHGDFSINAKPAASYDYTVHDGEWYSYDVTNMLKVGENVLSLSAASGISFDHYGGIGGVVWLQAEPLLSGVQNLDSSWSLAQTHGAPDTLTKFPGRYTGMYLSGEVNIPQDFTGKSVFLHVESPNQWLGLVLINGRPIYFTDYGQCYPTVVDINLAPFVKPGQVNHIELWPNRTMPRDNGQPAEQSTDIRITQITIGCISNSENHN